MNRQRKNKKMKRIDLHVHSTFSDGTFTPSELVAQAKRIGLSAIALTDHDSVDGIAEFTSAGEKAGIETVPGVELSAEYEDAEIHVVGLFINPKNGGFRKKLHDFQSSRSNRNLKMIDLLRKEGFDITAEAVYERHPNSVVARPHIARYLSDTHQLKDVQTAFESYIGNGCPCYVERRKISPMCAVGLIRKAEGIAILAHPHQYPLPENDLTQLIEKMKESGLDGIEVICSGIRDGDAKKYRLIAERYSLLLSGGSDFHGKAKPMIRLGSGKGDLVVPYDVLEKMREYIR